MSALKIARVVSFDILNIQEIGVSYIRSEIFLFFEEKKSKYFMKMDTASLSLDEIIKKKKINKKPAFRNRKAGKPKKQL